MLALATCTAAARGDVRVEPAPALSFRLPYRDGEVFRIVQGFKGPVTHVPFKLDYAVDFFMPKGTLILAARAGVVFRTEAQFGDGGRQEPTPNSPAALTINYVYIRHADGTVARYLHVDKNAVLVKVGQTVREGDPIARSGQSGTSMPHLHFDVMKTDGFQWNTPSWQTVPFTLRTDYGDTDAPEKDRAYYATGTRRPLRPIEPEFVRVCAAIDDATHTGVGCNSAFALGSTFVLYVPIFVPQVCALSYAVFPDANPNARVDYDIQTAADWWYTRLDLSRYFVNAKGNWTVAIKLNGRPLTSTQFSVR